MLTHDDYVLFFNGDKVLTCNTSPKSNPFVIPCRSLFSEKEPLPSENEHFFIGEYDTKKLYGVVSDQAVQKDGFTWMPARDALATTDKKTAELICRAKHLTSWHRNSLFSGCCGIPTALSPVEIAKICQRCKKTIYPTYSNFVIVLIEKDGKILLARSPHFAKGMYSTIAGFVEAGESYEDAVRREVMEEVGVKVKDITYFGSQSWPFPASMAAAFVVKHAEGEIQKDPKEIEDAQWFTLDNLPPLPHACSISRHIIDAYVQKNKSSDEKKS